MKKMLFVILPLACLIDYITFPHAAYAQVIDASPLVRHTPIMPENTSHSGHCYIRLNIMEDGTPVNVRMLFCTDNILENSAISSVKKSHYNPKKINGKAILLKDATVKITYKLADENGKLIPEPALVNGIILSYDNDQKHARISYQWPPYYGKPKKGERSEFCCVDYSVSQLGIPFNVTTYTCSHEKFAASANNLIREWEYEPVTLSGKSVSSGGYQQVIHFAKRARAMVKDKNGYTPIPGRPEDYERYCRAIS